jgi:cytochrome c5
MAEHDAHSSFIKTPQQLIVVILLAFTVPIFGIWMLVQLVISQPHADPGALAPQAVAARLQPLGKIEVGAPAAAPGARSGDEVVKTVCAACHVPGVQNAPKIGDNAAWAARVKGGLKHMLAEAMNGIKVKGVEVMPPKGGAADLTEEEVARAIVSMVNQSGGSMKEPAPKPAAAAAAKPAAKK